MKKTWWMGTPGCYSYEENMVDGYTCMLFFHFSKGNNFCDWYASLDDIALPNWSQLLKERICSKGSEFFSLRDGLH